MRSRMWIRGGLLLLEAALALMIYHLWDAQRAADYAEGLALQISRSTERQSDPFTREKASESSTLSGEGADLGYTPGDEMPIIEIEGKQYIGTLDIPALELSLPVMSECNDAGLRLSPCRYSGSVYQDDLIVAAHNYPGHFGGLKKLVVGDGVTFTDVSGNRFDYTVTETTQLPGTAIEEMKAGEWDLTLFTCAAGGRSRITIRCERLQTAE